jgi:acetate kinase
VDGIGLPSCELHGNGVTQKGLAKNHEDALNLALSVLQKTNLFTTLSDITAIGHRVVHGGEKYHAPVSITPGILKELKTISSLAPLHNPANLAGIEACLKKMPKTPNIAVFDTGFHSTLPEKAFLYGLPHVYYKKHHIRRYGFHGTSHTYVSKKAIAWLKKNKRPHQKIISCHIGNGVSVTAIQKGKSIDTSMGFTPLEGVMMGTRTGDFDPALIFYLNKTLKLSLSEIEKLVLHESGLKGLSGVSSDMRPLRAIIADPDDKKYPSAKRAFEVYVYRLIKSISSYVAPLGGLDALIFTAGIGENAWYLRQEICKAFDYLGMRVDNLKNKSSIEGSWGPIHSDKSKVSVLVIPTNEELEIAEETVKLLRK